MESAAQIHIEQENEYEIENENNPLNQMKIIKLYDYIPLKVPENKNQNYIKIISALLLICLIVIFILFFLIRHYKDLDYEIKSENNKNITKNNITLKTTSTEKKNNKIGIAFLYPKLGKFMITMGEYLINTGKYHIYFFTSSSHNKEHKYNKTIYHIYAYFNKTLIQNTCKKKNIEYIIINNIDDGLTEAQIKWLKSIGLKIIGVSGFSYMNKNIKSPLFFKSIELYDVFVQESVNAYPTLKKKGFKNNIYIPKLYDSATKSNLTNHNIILLGQLNDEKNIISSIDAMSSVIKKFPDSILKIISPYSKITKFSKIVKDLDLKKNVIFLPFNKTKSISSFCKNASIFLYSSVIEECPSCLNIAMSHGLPIIVSNDIQIPKDLMSNNGIIKINFYQEILLANELEKLLENKKYRIEKGNQTKVSMEIYNQKIGKLWERLFDSLTIGKDEYQKFRMEVFNQYNQTSTKKTKK